MIEIFKKDLKMVGLSISFLAAIVHLINFILFPKYSYYVYTSIGYLIISIISIGGVIVGGYKIKLGGAVILLSFPISIIIALIFSGGVDYSFLISTLLLANAIIIPYIAGPLLIIGGIVCLISSD